MSRSNKQGNTVIALIQAGSRKFFLAAHFDYAGSTVSLARYRELRRGARPSHRDLSGAARMRPVCARHRLGWDNDHSGYAARRASQKALWKAHEQAGWNDQGKPGTGRSGPGQED